MTPLFDFLIKICYNIYRNIIEKRMEEDGSLLYMYSL